LEHTANADDAIDGSSLNSRFGAQNAHIIHNSIYTLLEVVAKIFEKEMMPTSLCNYDVVRLNSSSHQG
jgi:hypothetical protein